ncbi:chemotaxis protein CheW [Terrihabitans rhizophilus]|uniref:Chemotaxis protein CheW n=1 Tax=Terrihabitans rhizophilus TaxID=3092662 RepID=A0ABU4RJC9_9HYPH|nr:chemotaxis protein CheW [Terrihabitans sp. PJ23]MDX6804952.1 chemotaxis protein CheW [Terrihabitans sp. PJ23]
MADPAWSAGQKEARRFLTFRIGARLYALPSEEVAEIVRVPPVTRVPHGPRGLLGVANLRGAVLPVASVRGLLGQDESSGAAASRAIVLMGAAPVVLAVDHVDELLSVDGARVETMQAELGAERGERLRGAFEAGQGRGVARILDIQALLGAAFTPRSRPPRQASAHGSAGDARQSEAPADVEMLVTFEVAGQEFGLPLSAVGEIVTAPPATALMPKAEALVLGVVSYRGGLLTLMSLRGLLGFPLAPATGDERVVVTIIGGVRVGLVADRMRAIIPADVSRIEPVPPVLAARIGGEAAIKSIYRGEEGKRLVSILAPEHLFREEVMRRLNGGAELEASAPSTGTGADRRFLVFRLGDDEFALPVEAVNEVARVPDQITRVPKAPAFLEGIVNRRGEVLPVIDQRRRFDMPELADGAMRRLVVISTQRLKAGIIVDSVTEVLRSEADAIEPAPDLAGETTQLVHGVITPGAGRMILLLDPAELLTRAEQVLLDDFATRAERLDP